MNENKKNRREWVKTAAIIFLSVMLLLTFFSNTIMNYSLPEVAAQYVQSGSITAKIRGTGVVESGDPYEIKVTETRKVSSVAVRVGDQVQKGDVLVYLEGKESEELENAKKALEDAQNAYDVALLAADVNAQIIQNANNNVSSTAYRKQITAAQAAVEQAEADVKTWQEKYDDITITLTILPADGVDTSEAKEELNDAKTRMGYAESALNAVEDEIKEIEKQVEYYNGLLVDLSGGDAGSKEDFENNDVDVSTGDAKSELQEKIDELDAKKAAAEVDRHKKQADYASAKLAYNQLLTALTDRQAEGTRNREALEEQKKIIEVNLNAAKTTLAKKEEELAELTADISTTLKLQTLQDAVDAAMEKVVEQEEKAMGGTVTADIAGTVTSINVTAGNNVSADTPVAVLQPEGKGYTMSFSVTNDQAKRLSVGDVADLVNSWRYEDVEVRLASIRPDTAEPGQKKKLTFDVTGSIVAGQTLNVLVGQKSANFDLIVPNSAIREDNNGKFVLIVESKSSPLGNRYVATRVDVEVLASDDTQSAISGALYGYEFVITTSNKPVEAGQLIRLPE